ncbi:formate dehydrogenase accessory sulfurtransferase FdhD [Marinobacter salinexigens]|uniref:Sulfur carrier protein FdhD n=2 Tax=Marinobacter salinexigens TaxID=2919747 RepID=A0A5B0VJ67_9GAMM|nr:formate dehydrogenase accessory sulfurtransferase FdhD [Marinobacter salinexigens]
MMLASSNNPPAGEKAADGRDLPAATMDVEVEVHGRVDHAGMVDVVAEEVPVALVYNGVSHAVMMATPGDLENFALGFSLTEGILQTPDELFGLDIRSLADGIEVDMHIAGDRFANLKIQRRNLTGRTGCGLCGTDSLAQAIRGIGKVPVAVRPDDQAVQTAVDHLREHQPLQAKTGATHGAAWCSLAGDVLMVREDVGRHNALDKLIGARIAEAGMQAFSKGFVLVSSRASYEMVQKSAQVGIGCLVAVSAPTALAIREAESAGMTLIGFARPGRHVTYTRGPSGPVSV